MQTTFLSLKLFLWQKYGQRYAGMIEILEIEGLCFSSPDISRSMVCVWGWILTKNEPSLRKPYNFGKKKWN